MPWIRCIASKKRKRLAARSGRFHRYLATRHQLDPAEHARGGLARVLWRLLGYCTAQPFSGFLHIPSNMLKSTLRWKPKPSRIARCLLTLLSRHGTTSQSWWRSWRRCSSARGLIYRVKDKVNLTESRNTVRNSLWKKNGDNWQMIFHQGTIVNEN